MGRSLFDLSENPNWSIMLVSTVYNMHQVQKVECKLFLIPNEDNEYKVNFLQESTNGKEMGNFHQMVFTKEEIKELIDWCKQQKLDCSAYALN